MAEDRLSPALKREVRERARGCCEYCLSQECFSPQPFSIEHVQPRQAGGQLTPDNLALACQGCNNHKYTKISAVDPLTGARTSLFHPRKHRWAEHFSWDEGFSLVIGLTPVGRATVAALQLNRPALVNFRGVLYVQGRHPPPAL